MTLQEQNYIALLSLALGGQGQVQSPCWQELLTIAGRHGTANMLYYGMRAGHIEAEAETVRCLRAAALQTAGLEEQRSLELRSVTEACAAAGLTAIPLKGSILRDFYPQPGMRHMTDTDLAVDPDRREEIRDLLNSLGWKTEKYAAGATDLYLSPWGFHYEIHGDLSEEGLWTETSRFCGSLRTMGKNNLLPPEEHYAYVLCHFVKHLLGGGVGVRQLMDLYLYRPACREDKLETLLKKLRLSDFDRTVRGLCAWWFRGGPPSGQELGDYLLGSGVFGTEAQRVTDWMLRETAHRSYFLWRIFPPFSMMKRYFPVLKKAPVLLPLFWIYRILRGMFTRSRNIRLELSTVRHTDREAVEERAAFYRRCGLPVYPEADQQK